MNVKISLVDNDFVVRAKTAFEIEGHDDPFTKFLHQIKEELIPGQTAYLEIEDSKKDSVTFEISQFE